MGFRRSAAIAFSFLCVSGAGCKSDAIPPETMAQIRASHLRMLTVDGRVGAVAAAEIMARMRSGGLDAAFFIVSVPHGESTASGYEAARKAALEGILKVRAMADARPSLISFASSPAEAYRLEKQGRHAAFIGLGSAYALGLEPSLIAAYYDQGVRSLTLSGPSDNAVCGSAFEAAGGADRGLSEFGRRVVAECNAAGMIIDLADASERSFFDVLAASRAPVIVSRAAARALCDRPGNLSDAAIRAVRQAGGVILVSMDPARLVGEGRARRATVDDVVDHVEHVVRVAGVESVGIGSGFGEGGGVSGCRDTRRILNVTVELLRRGWNEYAVEMAWGGNLMRVFKQAEALRRM